MSHKNRILRWVFAIGLMGCALALAKHGYNILEFIWFVPAMVMAGIGVGLILKDVISLATAPFSLLVDSIIFPKVFGGKPPPNYKLAEFYVKEERWEDAEAEFSTILKNHPGEKDAYLRLMDLLMERGDFEESHKVYLRAKRKLRDAPDDLSVVETRWIHLKSKFGV